MKQTLEQQLYQARLDAHCAVKLHQAKISWNEIILKIIDILAVCVPVGFFGVQVASSQFPNIASALSNIINPLLSASLLIVVIASFVAQSRSRLKEHQRFLSEEVIIIREIEELLSQSEITLEASKRILDWVARITKEEKLLFSKITEKQRREFYRAGLRESGDVHTICPFCGASPYQYQKPKGNMCQLCGNTPIKQLTGGTYESGN